MQMLDSKGDNNQGGGYNAPAQNGGYNAPAQGQAQSYQQPAQQQQQQQSYQQPSYNNNQASAQSREMPSSNAIPEIDIDEDEIPF
jgi:single-strand DNA-binding protein